MLPAVAYLRLWENQWSTGGGDALTPADIAAAFVDKLQPMTGKETGFMFVAGVDLGLTRDCSAVVVLGVPYGGSSGRIQLAHNRLWRPVLGKKIDLTEVESHILALDQRYHLEFTTFDPWQMEHLAQRLEADSAHRRRNQLRRFGSKPWMREVPPTAANLRDQATLVIESFGDRRLLLYPCEPLRRDLLKLRVEEKSYGCRLVSPRDGDGHGDTFSAFALALLVAHEIAGKKPVVAGSMLGAKPNQSACQREMERFDYRAEQYRREMEFLHAAGNDDGREQLMKLMREMGSRRF
jgi:phage terminase large subunit-like protein